MYVYKFLNDEDKIIYIGKAKSFRARMSGHDHLSNECYEEIDKIAYSKLSNGDEASIYERYLINKMKPKYNKEFNNDSGFRFELPDIEWLPWEGNINIKDESEKKIGIRSKLNLGMVLNCFEYCLNNILILKNPSLAIRDILKRRDEFGLSIEIYNSYTFESNIESYKSKFKIKEISCNVYDDLKIKRFELKKLKYSKDVSGSCVIYFDNNQKETISSVNIKFSHGEDVIRMNFKNGVCDDILNIFKNYEYLKADHVHGYRDSLSCIDNYIYDHIKIAKNIPI